MRTPVGIVGAGPAGLFLSHLLHLHGIESVVLERRDRAYCERRQRAGVVEHGVAEALRATGLGERMDREGFVHEGIELRFDGRGHRVDFPALTGGRNVLIWAQTEIVKDLIARRLADGGQVLFEAEATAIEGAETERPRIRFTHGGAEEVLECDYVVACDGFHGIGRASLPAAVVRTFEKVYPFAWLGILADVAPSCDELIYAHSDRGFALHSMRSETVSRLYLQVPAGTDPAEWSDDRIWSELAARFALRDGGWTLGQGPITDKGITPMRSFVTEPMRHGRLFLAGDAAHIVPPTGAKGLNLAMRDVLLLAEGLRAWFAKGDAAGLDAYSATALRRVWRAEHFSYWMTTLLHLDPEGSEFDRRLQISHLEHIAACEPAAAALAENYTGLPAV
ncbi:4-hydroxybenzoate 3-monooxygenase [Streptomonospora nanhaiensis]|uniref:p-hydroxybenzoate 3-monooxygenase n=1 Tax=Streptomonospora nanhaiensis TaxID=1323731 RepID=A0A853BKW4_9ACTN|nr:4-hydroxybenzoate 3-monooxygenase [Streptomonospora nanhaiensis]MBV2362998.1 4-hydroxybenzoate 3-monooxygenase [Streptomonospora nanhaiensis]MBX9387044.1 4-hydroxybenzoate 3-monooxygenase [Streptomonospora nanhaiensis]NYI95365.1 p-hydroxybenzoate 3-monooxygenase [Streptomonospora nanhaiensis]